MRVKCGGGVWVGKNFAAIHDICNANSGHIASVNLSARCLVDAIFGRLLVGYFIHGALATTYQKSFGNSLRQEQ